MTGCQMRIRHHSISLPGYHDGDPLNTRDGTPSASGLEEALADFQDASNGPTDSRLSVGDCPGRLARAQAACLVDCSEEGVDLEEYELLDDSANGDLHVVMPGRIFAFKGPRDDAVSRAGPWADRGGRHDFQLYFSVYAPLFLQLGAAVVVRLNEPLPARGAGSARPKCRLMTARRRRWASPSASPADEEAAGGGALQV
jgi:hypothetical protein